MFLQSFQAIEVTIKVTKGHLYLHHSIGHI